MTKRTDAPQTPARPVTIPAGDSPMPQLRSQRDGSARPAVAGSEPAPTTFVDPVPIPIQKATDLGSVQVLKHGNYYLLTDPFGDIHPDSRGLGLYDSDSRLVSCLSLRVGGVRPVLLQGSMGANFRGAIQLTNPSADRNPDAKVHPLDELVGRTIGIARDRLVANEGMEERVPNLQRVIIPDCGHWTQQEQPEAFSTALLGFLDTLPRWS